MNIEEVQDFVVKESRTLLPKRMFVNPDKWKYSIEDIDVSGTDDTPIATVRISWTRYGGMFNKAKETCDFTIKVDVSNWSIIKIKQVATCGYCGETISVNATRCPYCRGKFDD